MVKKAIIIVIILTLGLFFYIQKPASPSSTPTPISFEAQSTPTKPGIPSSHLIKTTFVPQAPEKNWDQPWQDACEEAAALTVHYYYSNQNPDTSKIVTDLNQMIDLETAKSWSHDVNLSQLSQITQELWDYSFEIVENPTVEQIKTYLSQNIPIIVTANGKTLFSENSHFKNGGPWYHALVILGYDDRRQQFTVHDVGTQFGKYFKYSYSLLMDSIHDFPPSLRKEDIDSGAKRILILVK